MRILYVLLGALAALGLAACGRAAVQPSTRFINPPQLARSTQYTHVVETAGDRTVYIAGQAALDAKGELVGEDDFRAQAQQVFENLRTALDAVGADFRHVVKMTTYVTDMSELAALREVRGRFMPAPPPANTLVQVVRLAREDFMVEIEAIAVLPE
jgi:2-iminobutanoate/2-iminopropanoate deaminase